MTRALVKPVEFLDERVGLGALARKSLRKVFPDHWSFFLGEIALYSFIILVLTGTFLMLWFEPSMQEVVYNGSYGPLRGVPMSTAFESTLELSFDVRGGLLMRQVHHWAANVFTAAILAHMLRIFFTGAFRKPREINWLIGVGLLNLALIEGFTGYSLPDDQLSGTGLRFVEALIRSIPVVGTYLSFFIFGGEYPGDDLIARLYPVHILLLPGLLIALITVHLALVVYHKHTQYPGAGRRDDNVVGYPAMPVYAAKSGGYFFIVFGVLTLMGALMQINPVWLYGPYEASKVGAGTQPDWYLGFVEGGLRIMPNWETNIGGFTISWNIFVPGVGLLGLLAVIMVLYPFVERWVTGDQREHHVLDRPRNQPVRTAFAVAAMTFYGLTWAGGGNDIIATQFHLSINQITWFLRIAVFIVPVVAFLVTKRICVGLQQHDRQQVLHGSETGTITQLPTGEFVELHAPIGQAKAYRLSSHERQIPLEPAEASEQDSFLDVGGRIKRRIRTKATRFYFADTVQKPTHDELEAAEHHHDDTHQPAAQHAENEAQQEQEPQAPSQDHDR